MTSSIIPNERSTRILAEFEFLQDPRSKTVKLGKGSFANVQLAKEKRSGNLVAMKIIDTNLSTASKSEIHNLQTEIKIHRELNHPNIIRFHDYIQEGLNIYLILEYAPNGNLYSFMHKKKPLSQPQIFRFFYQTCLAFQYLHQNDILHRDLKPENLLLDKDLNIKLCDFGWSARSIKAGRTTFCGTYEYMAPEIVEKRTYDYRVDIWSLGVLLYELVHGEAPYKGRSLSEITASLGKGPFQFRSGIDSDLRDLIQRILQVNPENRISLNEILSHNWVKRNTQESNHQNITETASLDNSRHMGRTQSSRVPLETGIHYNPVTDKENLLQGKRVHPHKGFENQTAKDDIVRALSHMPSAPDYFPDGRRRVERSEMVPGLLLVRENSQERSVEEVSKVMGYKPLERERSSRSHSGSASISLIKMVPERGLPAGIDVFNDYSKRPKFVERNMTASNPRLHISEIDPNTSSQNTTFDKGESPANLSGVLAHGHQKTRDILRKSESTRYYVRPNYFEKNATQQANQYASNVIVQAPQPDNNIINYMRKHPIVLKPRSINFDSRTVHNDYNDAENGQSQGKNPNIAIKTTDSFRLGTQRAYQYETYTPTSRIAAEPKSAKSGYTTYRSLPIKAYSKSQLENNPTSNMSHSPHFIQAIPSGWNLSHITMQPMGIAYSVVSSPLIMNQRYQSSK